MNNLNVTNYFSAQIMKLSIILWIRWKRLWIQTKVKKQILMFDHKMMLEYFVFVNWFLRIVYLAPE